MRAKHIYAILISIILSVIYFQLICRLFENDRHFSHLSPLEREMSFRTEMAFYYNYFKRMADPNDQIHRNLTEVTIRDSINTIINDNITEFPETINALKKFNIYPEVVIGLGYRLFSQSLDVLGLKPMKECFLVDRGADMSPVESCEGISEPIYFYVYSVFAFNSIVCGFLYLNSYIMSDYSPFGPILTIIMFAFNHSNSTRIQWTPPLRESFGYPIYLVLQTYVNHLLSKNLKSMNRIVVISLMVSLLVCWQFSPFLLLSQLICLFLTFKCFQIKNYSKYRQTFVELIKCNLYSVLFAFVLMFFNTYLINSLYFHFIISNLIYELLISNYENSIIDKSGLKLLFKTIRSKLLLRISINCLSVLCLTLTSKVLISYLSDNRDDSHIWLLMLSKISSYRDFHTMLYTCSPEFDFMPLEDLTSLTRTLLVPVSVLATVMSCIKLSSEPLIQFNATQSLLFLSMALFVMRLKLLFVPQLCLMCALLSRVCRTTIRNQCLFALLISFSFYFGIHNIKSQLNIIGEYFNEPLEQLIQFIVSSTHPNAVFAGIPLL